AGAGVALLIQLVAVVLDHVDEEGDGLPLRYWDGAEDVCTHVCQLCLVKPRPHGHLVVSLVSAQGVHLQLEEVHLWNVHLLLVGTIVVLTVLALALGAHALDHPLVVVADVDRSAICSGNQYSLGTHTGVDVKLELALGDCLLDALAVAGIAGGPGAALGVVQQTAHLVVAALRLFLRAEPVHWATV
ncbi:unnamed protein product, partial [Ixodes hexagonus]